MTASTTPPSTPPHRPPCLTPLQWQALVAIADGLVPSLSPEQAHHVLDPHKRSAKNPQSDEVILGFLACQASEKDAFLRLLSDVIQVRLPERARGETRLLLNIWTSTPGSLILAGTTTSLVDMSPELKESTIQGWYNSRLAPIRAGIQGISHIVRFTWMQSCPEYYQAVGFPASLLPKNQVEGGSVEEVDKPVRDHRAAFLSRTTEEVLAGQQVKVLRVGTVVVGAGSGGTSFVHSLTQQLEKRPELSTIDRTILILDKGGIFAPTPRGQRLGTTEAEGLSEMYENGAILPSDESGISIIAASTWGGGSRVNWSACLQTDRRVREEWTRGLLEGTKGAKAKDPHGRLFLGSEWQACMDAVERSLKVQLPEPEDHNPANATLLEGSRRLGYACKSVPQNIAGTFERHAQCGANCTIGCRGYLDDEVSKGKMSGCRAFLKPLLEATVKAEKNGSTGVSLEGMDGFEIEKVLFDDDKKGKSRRAIGVVGALDLGDETGGKVKLVVLADRTVVSAGTLNSPAILLRSGLKNPNIGKNLYLHPTMIVHSKWEQEIDPSRGGILTTAITEFDNLDNKGHGVKLEGMDMMPTFGMAWQPWKSAADFKQRLLDYKHTMGHIVLCREKYTGKIWIDSKTGEKRISYEPSAFDRAHILQGYLGLAKLLYTMGALEICANSSTGPVYRRDPSKPKTADWADDDEFVEFLRLTEAAGNSLDKTGFGSAHQMGTCRMGSSPKSSVVDTRGRVWGTRGLYVADASVFLSASGVNPMITTMTFGEWIGRRLGENLSGEAKGKARSGGRL